MNHFIKRNEKAKLSQLELHQKYRYHQPDFPRRNVIAQTEKEGLDKPMIDDPITSIGVDEEEGFKGVGDTPFWKDVTHRRINTHTRKVEESSSSRRLGSFGRQEV